MVINNLILGQKVRKFGEQKIRDTKVLQTKIRLTELKSGHNFCMLSNVVTFLTGKYLPI